MPAGLARACAANDARAALDSMALGNAYFPSADAAIAGRLRSTSLSDAMRGGKQPKGRTKVAQSHPVAESL
jgi:hypothetical protein